MPLAVAKATGVYPATFRERVVPAEKPAVGGARGPFPEAARRWPDRLVLARALVGTVSAPARSAARTRRRAAPLFTQISMKTAETHSSVP